MQFEAMEEWAEMANMDWIEFPPMSREEVEFKSTLAWYDFKRATELSASLADSLAQAGATDVLSNMTGLPLTLADLDPTVTAMAGQDVSGFHTAAIQAGVSGIYHRLFSHFLAGIVLLTLRMGSCSSVVLSLANWHLLWHIPEPEHVWQSKGLCVLQADCSSGSPAKQGLTMCNAAAISIAISTAINDALSPCLSRLSVFSHEWTAQYDDLKDQIVYAEEQVAACKVNTHSANNTASLPVVEGDDKTVELEQLYKRLNILQCNALRQVQANAILDVDTTLQQLKSDLEHIKRVARNSKQPIDVAMSSVDEGNADQVRNKPCIIASRCIGVAFVHPLLLNALKPFAGRCEATGNKEADSAPGYSVLPALHMSHFVLLEEGTHGMLLTLLCYSTCGDYTAFQIGVVLVCIHVSKSKSSAVCGRILVKLPVRRLLAAKLSS